MTPRTFFILAATAIAASLSSSAQQPPAGRPNPAPTRRALSEGYPEYDQAAVARGQKIFQSNCQFCHGANAKGGEGGPDLLRSVTVLHDKDADLIGPVVHNGRPDKGMPKFALPDDQVRDIATFLHQKVKDAALRGTYQILNIVTGDPKKGQTYFAEHCVTCHSVTGDLAHIGSKYDPVEVQQHVVMPRAGMDWTKHEAPSPKQRVTATVTMASGQTVEGYVEHIDDFNIVVVTPDRVYHSIARDGDEPKVVLHDPLKVHTDMLTKYTDADIHNLTAYLVTLK